VDLSNSCRGSARAQSQLKAGNLTSFTGGADSAAGSASKAAEASVRELGLRLTVVLKVAVLLITRRDTVRFYVPGAICFRRCFQASRLAKLAKFSGSLPGSTLVHGCPWGVPVPG